MVATPILGLFIILTIADNKCQKELKAYKIEEPKKQIQQIQQFVLSQKDIQLTKDSEHKPTCQNTFPILTGYGISNQVKKLSNSQHENTIKLLEQNGWKQYSTYTSDDGKTDNNNRAFF